MGNDCPAALVAGFFHVRKEYLEDLLLSPRLAGDADAPFRGRGAGDSDLQYIQGCGSDFVHPAVLGQIVQGYESEEQTGMLLVVTD